MHCRPRPRRRPRAAARCCSAAPTASAPWPWPALLGDPAFGRVLANAPRTTGPLAPRPPHFPAKARSVIFLYMDGGPSQVDTFDPKPRLDREHGQPIKMKTQPDAVQQRRQRAEVALEVPPVRRRAACRSATCSRTSPAASTTWRSSARWSSNFSEHTNANYFLHTGHGQQGRPSMGAWVTYGLGSECQDLPGFVVLNGGLIPPGGLDNFNSGFLPAVVPGLDLPARRRAGRRTSQPQRADRRAAARQARPAAQARPRRARAALGRDDSARVGHRQLRAGLPHADGRARADGPRGRDRRRRKTLYGLDDDYAHTQLFGRQCLLARRLVERGVRFVELTCPNVGTDRWDQHSNLQGGPREQRPRRRQPIAGLLKDLKARGLLDETLVVWAGEFGRTPMAQGTDGRDHNPFGFTHLAGRRRHQGRHHLRRDRRVRLQRRREQGARSTTCTPRCCTCWASTTSGSPTASAAATCG